MLRQMDFIVGEHWLYPDLNVEVRRGLKWAGLQPREDFKVKFGKNLMGEPSPYYFGATVIFVMTCRCKDIPIALLVDEHDLSCRDMPGLLCAMDRAYPGFQEDEIVTVVGYQIWAAG